MSPPLFACVTCAMCVSIQSCSRRVLDGGTWTCCCPWAVPQPCSQQDREPALSAALPAPGRFVHPVLGGLCVCSDLEELSQVLAAGVQCSLFPQGCPSSSVLAPNPFQTRSTGARFPIKLRTPRGEQPVLRAGIVLDN